MINGLLEASRGCSKEEIRMDVISTNLANSNVIGFKKDRVSFQKMLKQAADGGGSQPAVTLRADMEQGDVKQTGNELDVAIFGKGFFKVDTENGVRYTRKGNFTLDTEGNLITQSGDKVLGDGGPLKIMGNNITIDEEGNISTSLGEMGKIAVVDFEEYGPIIKEGKSYFANPQELPEDNDLAETKVNQRYVELSNVNTAEEMVNMIQALRAFESYQKSMRVIDELNEKAINQVGRLR